MSDDEKNERLKKVDPDKIFNTHFMDNVLNKIGIKSFSDSVENIQLWSHYANSHKGYCIQFKKIDSEIVNAIPVAYQARRPLINKVEFLTDEENFSYQFSKSLLVKSLDWQHEREHRVALHNQAYSYLKVNPQEITAIYFGCECDQNNIELLKRYVGRREINLLKCIKHDSEFKLIFEKLN